MTFKHISYWIVGIFIGFMALSALFGSWYKISEGERGVVTRYGKVVEVAQPGLGWKVPILDSVQKISVQDHVALYKDMNTYSRDQQPATLNVSVNYRILSDKVDEVYRVYNDRQGVLDRLVTRQVFENTKTVFGTFNAESSIRERERLNQEVMQSIQDSVKGVVLIISVQIEDISFSGAYEQSVEERMLAEVAVQKEKQNLLREQVLANIVREKAKAAADQVREAAMAEAEAIALKGNAEAEAITAKSKALENNSALIELVKVERWNGILPITMLPDAAMPFIGK